MRILFCDDDEVILEQIQRYVDEFFKILGGKNPTLQHIPAEMLY